MLGSSEELDITVVERILVIQLGDVGDVVLTTPVLVALKRANRRLRVMVAVREMARGLMELCPSVDEVFYVHKSSKGIIDSFLGHCAFFRALRGRRPEVAIDLRTGDRGAVISFICGAKTRISRTTGGGWKWRNALLNHLVLPDPELELRQYATQHHLNIVSIMGLINIDEISPSLIINSQHKMASLEALNIAGIQDQLPVALAPFSRWRYKELRPSVIKEIVAGILSLSSCVVLIGSKQEMERAEMIKKDFGKRLINLAGRTSLGDLAAVLHSCRLLVGVDSAAIHIAAAVGTPTIGVFGPSSAITWAPRGQSHWTVKKTWPCIPCRQKGCNGLGQSRCLNEMEADEVVSAVRRHMEELEKEPLRHSLRRF